MNFKKRLGIPVSALLSFCLIWEFVVWINNWPNYVMASPSDLGPAFTNFAGCFWNTAGILFGAQWLGC